jgi:hypothetical protein
LNAMLTTAGAIAGKELFKRVVIDLYQFLVQRTGRKLKQWNTERQIDKIYRQISQVRKVKTIWQIDRAVDLMEFYCDSHVILNAERRKVTELSDFGTSRDNILIQGIAGQGKSILLRYLCSLELGRGEYIPIFLELRRVSQTDTLKNRIFTAIESLGISVDDELFDFLAESGRILLLLDAFDEIPDDLKTRVLTEIEDLVATKQKLRVIVTSRPNQNIKFSNYFNIVMLDNLRGDEYQNVIKKLASGQSWADTLIDHIQYQASHIIDLLCTPLMVTLLVLSYKSFTQLPSKLSEFYDALFQTLLQRHDGTKPGFTRVRGCALDDGQYRQAFEALCIISKKTGQQSFTSESMYSLSKQALQQCDLTNTSPSAYIDDIVKITCLLLWDAEEHRFIHKTVQEYYTASYIQKKPEQWAIEFYKRIIGNGLKALLEWEQELEFLSEIDKYKYNKYCILPAILDFLSITAYDLDHSKEVIKLPDSSNLKWELVLKEKNNNEGFEYCCTLPVGNYISWRIWDDNMFEFKDSIEMAIERAGTKIVELIAYKVEKTGNSYIILSNLVKMGVASEFSLLVGREIDKIYEKAQDIWKSTKNEENSSLLEGLV